MVMTILVQNSVGNVAEQLINPANRHDIEILGLDLISEVIKNILYRCLSRYPAWINFKRSCRCVYSVSRHIFGFLGQQLSIFHGRPYV